MDWRTSFGYPRLASVISTSPVRMLVFPGVSFNTLVRDVRAVKYISDRVGVMYLGTMVEMASSDELYNNPLHPYTQALLSAVPIPDPDVELERERIVLEGDVPSPVNPPSGCRFRTRCPQVVEASAHVDPPWREVSPGHWVQACPCLPIALR